MTDHDLLEEELAKHEKLIDPQLRLLKVIGTTIWSMINEDGESGHYAFLIPNRKDKRYVEERTRREKLRDKNAYPSKQFRAEPAEMIKDSLLKAQAEFLPEYARWLRGEDVDTSER